MLKLYKDGVEKVVSIDEYITQIFPLENFSCFSFKLNDIEFKSGEHAFQFYKYQSSDLKVANEILNSSNPYEARRLGSVNKSNRISNWNEVKLDYLYIIFKAKAMQDEIVRKCLLDTEGYEIKEYCIDEDMEWRLNKNHDGQNLLGNTWMKVRSEILELLNKDKEENIDVNSEFVNVIESNTYDYELERIESNNKRFR